MLQKPRHPTIALERHKNQLHKHKILPDQPRRLPALLRPVAQLTAKKHQLVTGPHLLADAVLPAAAGLQRLRKLRIGRRLSHHYLV